MTSPRQLAERFGISTSTIRNYEAAGLIPPAERLPNGYRVYTELHAAYLSCIQAMSPAFGMEVTVKVLHCVRQQQPQEALWLIREREVVLYEVKAQVEGLIQDIRRYRYENKAPYPEKPFNINEAARLTKASRSAIRYWEHAGYLTADRDPDNQYRRYSSAHLLKIRLIQTMQNAVYSEDTVHIKRSIAAVEDTDLQGIMNAAERIRRYLDQVIEAQLCGIAYFHQLVAR